MGPLRQRSGGRGGGARGRGGSGTHLGAQGPGGQHVAAVAEAGGLHLRVAGPAERGDALDLGGALEHLHVVHQRLVALGDDGLVLRGGGPLSSGRGCPPAPPPPRGAPGPAAPLHGPLLARLQNGVLPGLRGSRVEPPGRKQAGSAEARGELWREGDDPRASHFLARWGQEGSRPATNVRVTRQGHSGCPSPSPGPGRPLPAAWHRALTQPLWAPPPPRAGRKWASAAVVSRVLPPVGVASNGALS